MHLHGEAPVRASETIRAYFPEGRVVLLEALAMHVPVVSSRIVGVPEAVVIGETGYMVPPGDVDALADAIVKRTSDPESCRRMGDAGRRMMEEKFDNRRQFDQFIEHFKAVSGR